MRNVADYVKMVRLSPALVPRDMIMTVRLCLAVVFGLLLIPAHSLAADDGPIAHWKLAEDGRDSSGNGNLSLIHI